MICHKIAINRPRLLAALLPLALAVSVAQASPTSTPVSGDFLLLAQHTDHTDSHVDGDHGSGGNHGAGGQGNRGQRQGKGAGTGEARGGRSVESDIFRDRGFGQGGPPEGRGEHEDGDDHDHEDGDEGGGPPEGRGEHEDGEEHDHTA